VRPPCLPCQREGDRASGGGIGVFADIERKTLSFGCRGRSPRRPVSCSFTFIDWPTGCHWYIDQNMHRYPSCHNKGCTFVCQKYEKHRGSESAENLRKALSMQGRFTPIIWPPFLRDGGQKGLRLSWQRQAFRRAASNPPDPLFLHFNCCLLFKRCQVQYTLIYCCFAECSKLLVGGWGNPTI